MVKKEEPKVKVVKKDSHSKLIGGTIIATLGLIIIMNNFGLLPWGILNTGAKLWPLILVFWGLKMLLK